MFDDKKLLIEASSLKYFVNLNNSIIDKYYQWQTPPVIAERDGRTVIEKHIYKNSYEKR